MIDTLIDYHDRASWLAARGAGVGASEVSALFGVSPWQSAYSLWAEKIGLAPPVEVDGEWLHWGQLLEEPIAQRYQMVTGRRLWTGGSPYCIAKHGTIPVFFCTPDRLVQSAPDIGRDDPGLLQVKNTAAFMAHNWDDGPPVHVAIQVQAEMACTGAEWASIAVLVGGNKFRYFDVQRQPATIAEIEEQVRWFWSLVESRTAPEIDGHEATANLLKRLHPADDGSTVDLPEAAIEWADAVLNGRALIADADRAGKQLKAGPENSLRAAIGSATFGRLPDGRLLSLKTTSRDGYTVEPTTYRTLKLETKGNGKR